MQRKANTDRGVGVRVSCLWLGVEGLGPGSCTETTAQPRLLLVREERATEAERQRGREAERQRGGRRGKLRDLELEGDAKALDHLAGIPAQVMHPHNPLLVLRVGQGKAACGQRDQACASPPSALGRLGACLRQGMV